MADRLTWWQRFVARITRDEIRIIRPAPPKITLEERYKRGMAVREFLSDWQRLQLAIDGDILRTARERRMR